MKISWNTTESGDMSTWIIFIYRKNFLVDQWKYVGFPTNGKRTVDYNLNYSHTLNTTND